MSATTQDRIYQRIGEFVVVFQWLEDKLRQIGWFLIDPRRINWPPTGLRNLSNAALIDEVHRLLVDALPKCDLGEELEADLLDSLERCVRDLHNLRRFRNVILHSAYIELKAGGKTQEILRVDPKLQIDEHGEPQIDQELLSEDSWAAETALMASAGLFLNRVHTQVLARYPYGDA